MLSKLFVFDDQSMRLKDGDLAFNGFVNFQNNASDIKFGPYMVRIAKRRAGVFIIHFKLTYVWFLCQVKILRQQEKE